MLTATQRMWYFGHGIPRDVISIIERGIEGETISRRDARKAKRALRASIEQYPDTEVLLVTLEQF